VITKCTTNAQRTVVEAINITLLKLLDNNKIITRTFN